jgi:predicted methyltransferase
MGSNAAIGGAGLYVGMLSASQLTIVNPGEADMHAARVFRLLKSGRSITGVFAGLLLAGGAAAQQYMMPADTPEHIRAAVESDSRPDEDRARDAGRRPAEVLTLAGIEPGDHVIELGSFGNYYTRMLVAAVSPDGQVDMIDLPMSERFGAEGSRALEAMYPNASYTLADYADAAFPQNVDIVFIVNHYHDMQPWGVDTAALNQKVYGALRSGGRYVVIDHKAADGAGWSSAESVHRIGAEVIVEEVTAAGFELDVDSDLLAQPDDDPTSPIFAPGTRGMTDRAVFIFSKP